MLSSGMTEWWEWIRVVWLTHRESFWETLFSAAVVAVAGYFVNRLYKYLRKLRRTLRVEVPIDLESKETGDWGRELRKGIESYLAEHRPEVRLGKKTYWLDLRVRNDRGNPRIARLLAYRIRWSPLPVFAVIGPISTGCAETSLKIYAKRYHRRPAIHLLPVPTGTGLLSLANCAHIFRLPPNNAKQADALVRVVKKTVSTSGRKAPRPWAVVLFTHTHDIAYIKDIEEQIQRAATELKLRDPVTFRVQTTENVADTIGELNDLGPAAIILVGPWKTLNTNADVYGFLNHWRCKNFHQYSSNLFMTDFSAPGFEEEAKSYLIDVSGVNCLMQLTPQAFDAHHNGPVSNNGNHLSSFIPFVYGHDALSLIVKAIESYATVDAGTITKKFCEDFEYKGRAQRYFFRGNENICGEYHVYMFEEREHGKHEIVHSSVCPCRK